MFVADVKEFPVVEQWLQNRKEDPKKAGVSSDHARTVMIDPHTAAANAHQYASGNLVKVSTRVLPMRCSSTQIARLLPRYIGPFIVTEVVHPGAIRLQLLQSYSATHDVFSVADIRPWFSIAERTLETEYPEVQGHPALNKIMEVLDRKRFGRAPANAAPHDRPATYFVVRMDGSTEWIPLHHIIDEEERLLVKKFEWRFSRSESRPCEPVSATQLINMLSQSIGMRKIRMMKSTWSWHES